MSREHELKCDEDYFDAVVRGTKTFELRYNDRGYQAGDTVWLRETRHKGGWWTNRSARFTIGYILATPGLREGWVAFSLLPLDTPEEG